MATKLLLIKDVHGLGRTGDIVSAKPGYVRNFLLPQGLALIADKKTLGMQARLQAERQKKAAQDKKEAESAAEQLKEKCVTAFVKTDHEGHLYGSVSAADVVRLLQEQHAISVAKQAVQLKHPIKTLGVTTVSLKLPEGIIAQVDVKVLAEGTTEEIPSGETASDIATVS